MISAPSASRRTTFPSRHRSSRTSRASEASSRSSGRIPSTTGFPSNDLSPGRAESVSSPSAIVCEPAFAASPPSCRSSVASTMFIAGLPMKPPTNRLTGWS